MTKLYLTRLCNNKLGWKKPDGTASKQEGKGSFCQENGFGHEEWLFRDDWLIEGWKYGFLQGVNDSLNRLRKDKEKTINVLLYYVDLVEGKKFRKAVAYITDLQILTPDEINRVKETIKENGWLNQMIADLNKLSEKLPSTEIKINKLGDKEKVDDIINVRFKFDNVKFLDTHIDNIIDAGSIRHLKLFNLEKQLLDIILEQNNIEMILRLSKKESNDTNQQRIIDSYIRSATAEIEVQRTHNKIQNALVEYLENKYGNSQKYKICVEKNRIDAYVESYDELILFEVKAYDSVLKNIREAIGQLLEYSKFNKPLKSKQSLKLVVVGNIHTNPDEEIYLEHLIKVYNLPIKYLYINASI